ncbi:hypothetical protein ACOSQ2_004793 [Xanthoceras sorbifolium]
MAGPEAQDQPAFMQQMVEFFQHVVKAAPQRSVIERLTKYRPTDFHGRKDEDAPAAEYWLERTEGILQQLHCTSEESLECAVSLLQEDAYRWWTSISQIVQPEERTWEFFQREFRRKYIGRIHIDNMKREFINLRQRQLTVIEYKREFIRLSKYAREMVATEADRCRRFEDGLNDYIRLQITALQLEDFPRLVSAALNVERVKKEEQAMRDMSQQRRGPGQFSSSQPVSKKFKGPQASSQIQQQRQEQGSTARFGQSATSIASTPGSTVRGPAPPPCEHCEKRHPGECWRVTGACYRCGSHNHFQKDCPKGRTTPAPQTERSAPAALRGRSLSQIVVEGSSHRGASESAGRQDTRTPARASTIRAQEDRDAPDVIVSMISIFDITASALIDPGSTHSFICTTIPREINLKAEPTEHEVVVSNPLGHSVIVNRVYRECPIWIQGYEFPGNLMELPFYEFDVILGMDWLSRHQVMIDCRLKRITVKTVDGKEVNMVGERSDFL